MAKSKGARLYALVARNARKAVVFRRGPSKSVLVLAWDLRDDTLEAGQWFKGRIYERRCDLSPDGDLLVYFAARYRGPYLTWTAVSRPPYLTALALWPKGDAWGGGGLFADNRSLQLNHLPGREMQVAPEFPLPKGFSVQPLGATSGRGEDDPIVSIRLERDGWVIVSPGQSSDYSYKTPVAWRIDPPKILEKPLAHRRGMVLRTSLHGVGERDGTWYVQTGHVLGATGEVVSDLGRIDWADVDHNGDVLFARDGCLFRLPHWQMKSGGSSQSPSLVADLNALRFEAVSPPSSARSWPKSVRTGKVS